jgi:hypothetical protein
MRRTRNQTGMSLVEASIILLVLMMLTSVLAPSISDYFKDAQSVKVKEDCEAIGVTVMRLVRDVGPCLKLNGQQPCTVANRADILISDGPPVDAAHIAGLPDFVAPFAGTINTANWTGTANTSPMAAQFVTNSVGYTDQAATTPPGFQWSGPQFGLGWRGAYLSSPIGPDPWGMPYVVNSAFLAPAAQAGGMFAPVAPGANGWPLDTFCLSAGANMQFETPFARNSPPYGTVRGGDDFIFVISGGTR